jgi:hypothetical protein
MKTNANSTATTFAVFSMAFVCVGDRRICARLEASGALSAITLT